MRSWWTPGSVSAISAAAVAAVTVVAGHAEPKVDFARDVRPLLQAKCFGCHGPARSQGGLRLDRKQPALLGGDSGAAIKPGHGAESLLIRLVSGADPKKVMPPAGARLTPDQIKLLQTWIDQGAEWPGTPADQAAAAPSSSHWAFQPVKRPALPPLKLRSWVRNPIDAFILARLEAKGLKPSPTADRVTLIRRLSLDLLGLPPSVEEVEAFVNDRRPDAYERLVDRLLASPHYGERWGRRWLDAARYADTNGYTIDSPRQIWKYRDWVIDALNRDLPFDQFTIHQLAGDLWAREELRKRGGSAAAGAELSELPADLRDAVVATGFHRNTMINEEGGTDKEQFRVEAVVDRVSTTGAVWLGLTLGCAQCHSHKFDPITQREFYQFFAFFNNADEPSLALPTPEQQKRQAELKQRLAAARRALAEYQRTAADRRQAAWEAEVRRQSAVEWRVLDPAEYRSAAGADLRKLPDHSLLLGGKIPDHDTYTVNAEVPARATAVRLEVLTHESLPNGGPGLARGNFLLTDFSVAEAQPAGGAQAVPIRRALADHSQQDFPVTLAVDGDPKTGWAINVKAGEGKLNTDRTAVFVLERPVPAGTRLTITLKQEHPNKRYLVGRFRLAVADADPDAIRWVPSVEVRDLLAVPPAQRTPEQRDRLAREFARAESKQLAAEVAALEARGKELAREIPSTMILRERETPRETYIHLRGDFLRRGDRVQPAVPAVFPPLSTGSSTPNRLDLARWLVDPRNPLTARVTVNRIWQGHFGIGLVETENDFGTQGTPPSHPELLDWLAWTFAAPEDSRGASSSRSPAGLGWSLKKLHRLIVTSNTYKQSSRVREDLAAADPENRLLGQQNRIRLDAELIRDVSLAASGLLSRKMGGPGVYPPQPAGTDLFTQVKRAWTPSQGEDRYRRGIYTWQWRTNPYPLFATFDAPGGTVTCTRRPRSNTPTQALMLANDQSLFEMAQALGTRALDQPAASEAERIRWMFRRCLSREPEPAELTRLSAYYRSQLQGFAAAPDDARAVAPRDLPAHVPPAQAAAWTAVARVLMNLDEFITRE